MPELIDKAKLIEYLVAIKPDEEVNIMLTMQEQACILNFKQLVRAEQEQLAIISDIRKQQAYILRLADECGDCEFSNAIYDIMEGE